MNITFVEGCNNVNLLDNWLTNINLNKDRNKCINSFTQGSMNECFGTSGGLDIPTNLSELKA